ncbi:MAG: hypothetical protein CDV28_14410 [Candidatus Electronema aureum]|uniref:Lipoprotein n=1 Tax=Candidatus Electronema aureum TaxID=2005002 RepID=A0A521FZ11_9BACT|nr:MAG: hypothetical protein CDV28_14410 [Candidatus Electronema aureum]
MKLTKRTMLIPVASLLLLSGCAIHPKSEYADFSQAGSEYAKAVDKVLVTAEQAQIDSTSWSLVQVKGITGVVSAEKYDTLTKEEAKLLATIQHLRFNAKLLADYFAQLELLATSDAPDQTKTAINNLVTGMNKLSTELKVSSPDVVNTLPQLAKVVVNTRIKAVLRAEFEKRQELIRTQLQIHELLLKTLDRQITHALTTEAELKEILLVKQPLLSDKPLSTQEDWVAKRRAAIQLKSTVNDIKPAIEASKKMRLIFEKLLAGNDAQSSIHALVVEIKHILATAHAVKP